MAQEKWAADMVFQRFPIDLNLSAVFPEKKNGDAMFKPQRVGQIPFGIRGFKQFQDMYRSVIGKVQRFPDRGMWITVRIDGRQYLDGVRSVE
jgi:hypothetical protein